MPKKIDSALRERGPALAPLSVGTLNHRSARPRRPALSARRMTGSSPAADTMFGSSNDAAAVRAA
jgi:hypothetical protein